MIFSSILFLFTYFLLVLGIYYCVPIHFRNLILLIASLLFYAWGEPIYVFIMVFSMVFDYFNGYMVNKYAEKREIARKFVLLSVVGNLAILGFFKYYDFIATNLISLGINWLKPLNLALPIGISFYTFQTMSYPIDVYRKSASVQKNMISFGTYVTLFPQLVAGPIVRYKDISDQLDNRKENVDQFYDGILYFTRGLAKKVLLANGIGSLSDMIFKMDFSSISMMTMWLGAMAFAFQIYFDFSGYSEMAIGLGKMFGFDFPENFNYPYISKSITEFWRRWHISLSTWFRDYVYIPLGGNRKGKLITFRNIFIVWALTGFWHGASWNFLLWGIYFGTILMLEKAFLLKVLEKLPVFIQHIYALILILIGWIIFSITEVANIPNALFGLIRFTNIFDQSTLWYLSNYGVLLIICLLCSTPLFSKLMGKIKNENVRMGLSLFLIMIALVLCVAYLVDASYNPFLYFRF